MKKNHVIHHNIISYKIPSSTIQRKILLNHIRIYTHVTTYTNNSMFWQNVYFLSRTWPYCESINWYVRIFLHTHNIRKLFNFIMVLRYGTIPLKAPYSLYHEKCNSVQNNFILIFPVVWYRTVRYTQNIPLQSTKIYSYVCNMLRIICTRYYFSVFVEHKFDWKSPYFILVQYNKI